MIDPVSDYYKSGLEHEVYRLILFVAGVESNSMLALNNLEDLCRAQLDGRYELQVVDVFKDHKLALKYHVLVTPCVVLLEPPPSVMIAGTLQNQERVLSALRIRKE